MGGNAIINILTLKEKKTNCKNIYQTLFINQKLCVQNNCAFSFENKGIITVYL